MTDTLSEFNPPKHDQLEYFIERARAARAIKTAVIHPVEANSLAGAIKAAEEGLIEPILVGPEYKIREAAEELNLNLSDYTLVDAEHSHQAAELACDVVRQGDAEALMKGTLGTSEMLQAVLHKQFGLRTERRLSHLFVFDVPNYHKPLIITDAAINIVPDLMTKKDIVQNAIDFCHAVGNPQPKIAILSAVEKVKPSMLSTIEAAALCKMADREQIKGGILDGPLAFDNAISTQAAIDKHIKSDVAGDADVLIAPDLEAGNMIAKQLMYFANAKSAGLVVGSRVPIILNSRSDGVLPRLASCALASHMVHHGRKL